MRGLSVAGLIGVLLVASFAPPHAHAATSIIPIPEIIFDPNEGDTYGVLAVVLFLDEKDEIRYLLAPDFRYNETTGPYPHFRFFAYPTPERRYSIVLAKSTTKDEKYESTFEDRGYGGGHLTFFVHALYERDSTERFFGFGNDSIESDESNYTSEITDAEATPGVWLLPTVHLSYRMRIFHEAISGGQVDSVPFIGAPQFLANPDTDVQNRGLEPGVYWSHGLRLAYETRDSRDLPTEGALAVAYVDAADRRLGSSTSFVKFGVEGRKFVPLREVRNPIVALRVRLDYVSGSGDTPFWEMSRLGGRWSLRGFGNDRFIDFNRSLAGAEVRTRIFERRLFGVKTEFEVAPFVETGQVFHEFTSSPVGDLHWVGGIGFRAVVRPQVVGFVDLGEGSEGLKVFSGIEYPF
jgi:outer membrane protein assembly factor BamA